MTSETSENQDEIMCSSCKVHKNVLMVVLLSDYLYLLWKQLHTSLQSFRQCPSCKEGGREGGGAGGGRGVGGGGRKRQYEGAFAQFFKTEIVKL